MKERWNVKQIESVKIEEFYRFKIRPSLDILYVCTPVHVYTYTYSAGYDIDSTFYRHCVSLFFLFICAKF